MQRRINKRLSSALRNSSREEVDEETGEVDEEEVEDRQPKERSSSRNSTKAKPDDPKRSSQKSVRVSMSPRDDFDDGEDRDEPPTRSKSSKPSPRSSKKPFEFRNSRLGAAFLPSFLTKPREDLEDEEEQQSRSPEEEDGAGGSDEDRSLSPPPEEQPKKKPSSRQSSREDIRRKSRGNGSSTSLKNSPSSSKVKKSSKTRTPSKDSLLKRSPSKKSLLPQYFPQIKKSSSLTGKPRLISPSTEYFYPEDIDDAASSPPESSTTSFSRPLGLTSSSTRLPPLYDLRRTSNYPRRSSSRDVTALPIEIPESVTDEAAFRRYLATASYESVGGGNGGCSAPKLPAQMAVMQQTLLAQLEGNKRTMTLSYAIMTLALLSASATQLRFLVAYSRAHAYSLLNYFLVCLCIVIEVVVGLGYVVLSRFTSISEERVESIHNYLISGLFVVAVANVIIAAFAFDDHVCEVLAKQTELFDSVDQSPQIQIPQ